MNHDAKDQLDWLSQVLSQDGFIHAQTNRSVGTAPEGAGPGGSSSEGAPPGEHEFAERIEIRPDPARERRKGVPEVIFGETKTTAQVLSMARSLLDATGRAIISRVRQETLEALRQEFRDYALRICEAAHALVIYRPGYHLTRTGGRVGVLSAGTSDIPVAEEAALMAEEMGCQVTCVYDVGVAGLHRLLEPLRALLASDVDVMIVAAGMDGALPSVVAGLVPVPVIGLPTSVGYGLGGQGVAALLSMLQTCAPGLSVVNIDNGIGAGSTAALIANRAARAAEHRLS
ncbi:MAG TPA: nickel pincer cofactor biosynthesis protein LarB [Ktedonobacteraceae bacterium]